MSTQSAAILDEQTQPTQPTYKEPPALRPSGSANLTPVVESFTLESTLPPRLLETVDWYYKCHGIQDPEDQIAGLFRRREEVSYSGFMADFLAYASTWAYADPATFAFMMAHRGLKKWRYYYMRLGNDPLFVVSSAYLMQSYNGEVAVLVFRGTEPINVPNWLTDLTVSPERFFEGRVHGGILRNLRAIWPLASMGLFTVEKRRSLMLLPLTKLSDERDTFEGTPSIPPPTNGRPPVADNDQVGEYDDPRKILKPLKALYITGHSLGGGMAALAAAQVHHTSS